MTAAVLFLIAQSAAFAQKSSEAEKKKQEQIKLMEEASKEKARAEELYRQQYIDAQTRRAEVKAIDESIQFMDNRGTGYSVAYPDGFFGLSSRSTNSETLEYRKTVNESTFTKDLPFEVEEGARNVSISVSGACKEGEIRIKILMPGGKTYTEVLLDEYGSVNWKKSFSTDEEKTQDRVGEWKFIISSKEATGNFSLSIRSN